MGMISSNDTLAQASTCDNGTRQLAIAALQRRRAQAETLVRCPRVRGGPSRPRLNARRLPPASPRGREGALRTSQQSEPLYMDLQSQLEEARLRHAQRYAQSSGRPVAAPPPPQQRQQQAASSIDEDEALARRLQQGVHLSRLLSDANHSSGSKVVVLSRRRLRDCVDGSER